jgi:transposase-like protein
VQSSNGDAISSAYDADGVRVSKTVNGVTIEYLVGKNLPYAQVLEELVNDSAIASYVSGLDLISQERGNADSYYLVDGLGSTRGLTNTSGAVTDTYAYAFGNLIASGGNIENDYLFAGEQFDEDLYQFTMKLHLQHFRMLWGTIELTKNNIPLKAYSVDLRSKIVAAHLEQKLSIRKTAEIFACSKSLVQKLVKQQKIEGNLQPKPRGKPRYSHLNNSTASLREIVPAHPDATLL